MRNDGGWSSPLLIAPHRAFLTRIASAPLHALSAVTIPGHTAGCTYPAFHRLRLLSAPVSSDAAMADLDDMELGRDMRPRGAAPEPIAAADRLILEEQAFLLVLAFTESHRGTRMPVRQLFSHACAHAIKVVRAQSVCGPCVVRARSVRAACAQRAALGRILNACGRRRCGSHMATIGRVVASPMRASTVYAPLRTILRRIAPRSRDTVECVRRADGAKLMQALGEETLVDCAPLFVEVLLSLILSLPAPRQKQMYFSCMIVDLCKLVSAVPLALEAALNQLFLKVGQAPLFRRVARSLTLWRNGRAQPLWASAPPASVVRPP